MSEEKANINSLEVYSREWWQSIPEALTFIPQEQRQIIVFSMIYGGIQM